MFLAVGLISGCGARALSGFADAGVDAASATGSGGRAGRSPDGGPTDDARAGMGGAGGGSADAAADAQTDAPSPRDADPAPDAPSPRDADAAPDASSSQDADAAPDGPACPSGPLLAETQLLAVSNLDIYELDHEGVILQRRTIPGAETRSLDVCGAAATGRQLVHIAESAAFAISPRVSLLTLDLAAGTEELRWASGYRVAGLVGAFGIAAAAGYVYVSNFDDDPGMFRFDLADDTYVAVPGPEWNSYTVDVSTGRDGLVHLLTSGLLLVSYDPGTLAVTSQVTLDYQPSGIPIRGVAVDADGTIFASAEQGQMLRFDAAGKLVQKVRVPNTYYLDDVDLDAQGRVLFGSDSGQLVITDRALSTPRVVQLPTTDKIEIVVIE